MSANRNSVEWMCASNVGCCSLLRSHAYAYDGWNLILERIARAGGATDEIEYFWGSDLSGSEQGAGGVGGLVALSINGAFYFPCYDNNGNIIAYVDESGSLAAQFAYDAFGNPLATSCSELATLLSFRFSTKYLDPETGFYYYGYRYYNPDLGRWLTRDPIEEQGGLNLYGFCGNDGVNRWDKLGLKEQWTFSATWVETMEGVEVVVTFTMNETQRKCCKSVTVDRYVRRLYMGGTIGPFVLDHQGEGGQAGFPTGKAEGDYPDGPGLFLFELYRAPWTQTFKWKARCVQGVYSGRIFSERVKNFRTSGHLYGQPFTGVFFD